MSSPENPPAFDLTITRAERNPFYKQPPKFDPYGHERDERAEHEREFEVRRVLSVSLTETEFEAVKRALIAHWADAMLTERSK